MRVAPWPRRGSCLVVERRAWSSSTPLSFQTALTLSRRTPCLRFSPWLGLVLAAVHPGRSEDSPAPKPADGYTRSVQLAEEALRRHPGEPALIGALAAIQFRRGRFREARELYEALTTANAGNLDAWLGRAECHLRLGELDLAVAGYEKVIEAQPPPSLEAQSRRGLAETLLKLGRFPQALQQVEISIKKGDTGGDMHVLHARILDGLSKERSRAGDGAGAAEMDRDACEALEKALGLDPGLSNAHYLLATILRRRGDAQGAKSHLDRFLDTRKPESITGNAELAALETQFETQSAISLGRALLAVGDAALADSLSAYAMKVGGEQDDARAFRAWVLSRLDRKAEAARLYEELLARSPRHPEALWNLGKIRLEERRMDVAAQLLLAGAEARGSAPDAWMLLAELALSTPAYPGRAEEFARRALKSSRSPAAYALLARALQASGQPRDARRTLDEGLKAFPGAPELSAGLEALESYDP